MRQLERYIARYGPDAGPRLYHLLQSQAGHAIVSARLRRKIATLTQPEAERPTSKAEVLPLFPESAAHEKVAVVDGICEDARNC